jgi:single-strand DNA-binding protein
MASCVNKVMLLGRLTRDPELRYTPKGTAVCDLGVALNRVWTDPQSGEKREDTTFVDVTVWQRTAEICAQYLKKGRQVFLEGRLQMDTWEQEGAKKSKLKVVAENVTFLDGGNRGGESGGEGFEGGGMRRGGGATRGGARGPQRPAPAREEPPASEPPMDEPPPEHTEGDQPF